VSLPTLSTSTVLDFLDFTSSSLASLLESGLFRFLHPVEGDDKDEDEDEEEDGDEEEEDEDTVSTFF